MGGIARKDFSVKLGSMFQAIPWDLPPLPSWLKGAVVLDRWPGWGHFYLKVMDREGVLYILRASATGTRWEKVMMEAPQWRVGCPPR